MAVSNDATGEDSAPAVNNGPQAAEPITTDPTDPPQAEQDPPPVVDQEWSLNDAGSLAQNTDSVAIEIKDDAHLPPTDLPPADLDDQIPLQQALIQAQADADQQHELLLRAYAENENLRKRSARDLEQTRKYGLERFISDLLPIKDSMELGVTASQEDGLEPNRIREGMELTLRMLTQAIEKFGVQPLDPMGETFNPQFHEAMTVQDNPEAESGTVLLVIQKGYLLNERLIRPAKVIVAK